MSVYKESEESRKKLETTYLEQREIEKGQILIKAYEFIDIKTCRTNLQQLQVQKYECELVIKV